MVGFKQRGRDRPLTVDPDRSRMTGEPRQHVAVLSRGIEIQAGGLVDAELFRFWPVTDDD